MQLGLIRHGTDSSDTPTDSTETNLVDRTACDGEELASQVQEQTGRP